MECNTSPFQEDICIGVLFKILNTLWGNYSRLWLYAGLVSFTLPKASAFSLHTIMFSYRRGLLILVERLVKPKGCQRVLQTNETYTFMCLGRAGRFEQR